MEKQVPSSRENPPTGVGIWTSAAEHVVSSFKWKVLDWNPGPTGVKAIAFWIMSY